MSLASKIILGLTIFASLPLAWLSMVTLQTHARWRGAHQSANDKLARLEVENRLLADSEDEAALVDRRMYTPGTPEAEPGLRQLKQHLHRVLVDRGRAWYGAMPLNVDPNSGLATVQLGALPSPHNIEAGMGMFVFEERDVRVTPENPQPGAYLGEFVVTGVAEENIQLQPVMTMSPREHDRLLASRASGVTWALYEVMPVDRPGLFAGLTEEELLAFMPEPLVSQATREQYLKDGKPAQPGDPAEHVEDGAYRRPLTDYMVVFREHHRLRALAMDRIEAKAKDNELSAASLTDVQKQQEFRRQEIATLGEELTHTTAERDVVKAVLDQYEAMLAAYSQEVERTMAENKRLAAQWQALQLHAAREIDEAIAQQQAVSIE